MIVMRSALAHFACAYVKRAILVMDSAAMVRRIQIRFSYNWLLAFSISKRYVLIKGTSAIHLLFWPIFHNSPLSQRMKGKVI